MNDQRAQQPDCDPMLRQAIEARYEQKRQELFEDVVAANTPTRIYLAACAELKARMEDEIDEAIALFGNIHAPKPQGVLTGKTIFARDASR